MTEQVAQRAARPAILTVDDDPSVSRSVARDLRRRYGEGYRIVRADRGSVKETKLVGHRWSARSYKMRDFLARNQVPYRWYLADEPEGERLLAAAGADASMCPVVITGDGRPLVQPTNAELADRIN